MRSRGRDTLRAQFKAFYRDQQERIAKIGAGKDYYALLNLFAGWLNARSAELVPELPEKVMNIVMSRTLPEWSQFCAIVDTAAEEMFWDTPVIRLPGDTQ